MTTEQRALFMNHFRASVAKMERAIETQFDQMEISGKPLQPGDMVAELRHPDGVLLRALRFAWGPLAELIVSREVPS
jgi:hypothetical protein